MLKLVKALVMPLAAGWLLVLSPAVSCGQFPGADQVQTWTDDTLQHKIEAKFKGMEGNLVKLETADGSVKKIPYAKLSLSSQLKVKKMADPRSFDAPPLPSSYSAPPISDTPFAQDDTIEKYLETLFGGIKSGKADVVWHSLPPAVKADVEASVVKIADILGPSTFKQMQFVLPNVHTVVRDKRSFIAGTPAFTAQPAIPKIVNQVLPAMEPLVGVLTKQTTWNSENFKEGKVASWIMLFANDGLSAVKTMFTGLRPLFPAADAPPDLNDIGNFKVVEKTADTATVEFTMGKQKNVTKFKKVDGYWVADWQEKMFSDIAAFKTYLDNLDQAGRDEIKNNVRNGLTAANTVFGALAKAKTQQEFSQLFDPIASEFLRGFQASMSAQQRMAGGGMNGMSGMPGMSGMNSGGEMPNSGGANGPVRKGLAAPGGQ